MILPSRGSFSRWLHSETNLVSLLVVDKTIYGSNKRLAK
jgi:hypothetical protein